MASLAPRVATMRRRDGDTDVELQAEETAAAQRQQASGEVRQGQGWQDLEAEYPRFVQTVRLMWLRLFMGLAMALLPIALRPRPVVLASCFLFALYLLFSSFKAAMAASRMQLRFSGAVERHRRTNGSFLLRPTNALLGLALSDRDFDENDYELLLALDENTPTKVMQACTQQQVQRLPLHTIAEGEKSRSCAVCLEMTVSGEAIRTLPCLHQFHSACVDQWLLINGKCPICKFDCTCF